MHWRAVLSWLPFVAVSTRAYRAHGTPCYDDVTFDGSLWMEDYRFFPNRLQVTPGTTINVDERGCDDAHRDGHEERLRYG